MLCTTSACFNTMIPTPVEDFWIILWTSLVTFLETIFWLVNPQNKEIEPNTPVILIIIWKVKYPRNFIASYVQSVIQQYESKTAWKEPQQSSLMKLRMISITKRNHHVPTTFLSLSKDEWDTKEGTGKSMKNTAVCQNAPLGLKRCWTAKN